jgi:hypothetical protein
LLAFYMRRAWEAGGLGWDSDNEAEMAGLAEAIANVAADAIREHAENEPHLHPDGSRS